MTDRWSDPQPPARVERPMLFQAWRDCAFLHWSFPPEVVRPRVPANYELDTFDGRAWVSLIAFEIAHMHPGRSLPAVPGLSSALEAHLRTYVRGPDGRRGIWMLSIEMAPLQAALLGRFGFALPYWWADMDVTSGTEAARYRSRRRSPAGPALSLDLRLGDPIPATELEELDHFVTARWVLYSGFGPISASILVEHAPWELRRAEVLSHDQDLLSMAGLPTREPDRIHFSPGVDALLAWPRISLAG